MRVENQVLCAAVLDLLWGDPRGLPHPVKIMGTSALALEGPLRRVVKNERIAGVLATACIVCGSGLAATALVRAARRVHPVLGDLAAVGLLYTALAARDLADHAHAVLTPLEAGNISQAQQAVARMVGRDTAVLDEAGVVRAAVESVAENTVDGVVSPLFYAFLGGAPAAMLFKAASTLDSTFGYKNPRYLHFGWASARLDDLLNYVPARLNVLLMAGTAKMLAMNPRKLLQTVCRDGGKHESPNSGLAEAAMAGALGVQLGGSVYRQGRLVVAPTFGEAREPLRAEHIEAATRLMWATTGLAVVCGYLARRLMRRWLARA
ncbi:MAG: cobalamin biosynthesis protein CobD [Thermoleophilia bacterium]|nr:cobalamin biosynthesis protein CobD [Thermoleophilia bacterium]